MCGLIAHMLKHRDKTRTPIVHTPPSDGAPDGMPCRSPLAKGATDSPIKTTPSPGKGEARFDGSSPCDDVSDPRDKGVAVSAGVVVTGAGIGRNTQASPNVWQSPPRVKRVSGEGERLPTLARCSSAGRKLRRRRQGAGLSSSYLAAAIGCPISTPAAVNETAGRVAGQDSDQHRSSKAETDSISDLFRMGLDFGQKRFRGARVGGHLQ